MLVPRPGPRHRLAFRRLKRSSSPPAWTPASLPTLAGWYRRGSGVWSDSGGWVPCAVGSTCARWSDASGAGNDLVMWSGVPLPVLAGGAGVGVGSSPVLSFGSAALGLAGPLAVGGLGVARDIQAAGGSFGSTDPLIDCGFDAGSWALVGLSGGSSLGTFGLGCSIAVDGVSGSPAVLGSPSVVTVVADSEPSASRVILGGWEYGPGSLGLVLELVLLGSAPSAGDLAALASYLAGV
jgi:hypothetical protein